jgi:hypothetical protein
LERAFDPADNVCFNKMPAGRNPRCHARPRVSLDEAGSLPKRNSSSCSGVFLSFYTLFIKRPLMPSLRFGAGSFARLTGRRCYASRPPIG